ncbi:MAG: AMP-binding protein, partial [Pseudomonadota bacterium]|nr:AMP-binding protein [Pseudomonadota bacterium]
VVQVEKSPENVLLYLAALRAGLVYVPLNTAYTAAELAFFLGDAEPAVVVCRPVDEAAVRAMAGAAAVVTLDANGGGSLMDDLPDEAAPVAMRTSDDLAAILYTSGTTGRSKGAMLSHGNLYSNAATLKELWQWDADDVLIHILPIYHVHGLFVALHGALLAGASVIFYAGFDPEAVIADFARATVLMGVPTHYTRLIDHPGLTRAACKHMRLFVSGSAPLLAEAHDRFAAKSGQRILERYGMTETGMITSNPYDGERVAGTVGFPLPKVSVRLRDDQGQPVELGEPGILEVRGPNVFKGYWRNPAKTAEEFRDGGYFVTGDVATRDSEGRITLVGRAKDMIIAGGLNIYPKEIEEAIDALAGVAESAVIGVPHPDLGEAVVAVVAREPGAALTETGILSAILTDLARFKQPRRVFIVDSLPRNAMGKVQKAALRSEYASLFVPSLPLV